jgi:homoserine dehydrogenase
VVVREAVTRGEHVKLVGELAWRDGAWTARVEPRVLPVTHPLGFPGASRNALWLEGEGCGELFFSGGGGGGLVTASAVVGDLLSLLRGVPGQRPLPDVTRAAW